MLGQLRTILHNDVMWFGCSATLDALGEELMLKTAGFRRVGNGRIYETTVIRTSVDRPGISLSLVKDSTYDAEIVEHVVLLVVIQLFFIHS